MKRNLLCLERVFSNNMYFLCLLVYGIVFWEC